MSEESTLTVIPVSEKEYGVKVGETLVFQQTPFLELNKEKVDSLEYLFVNKGGSSRFAMNFGISSGIAKCPFSSPCGYPISLKRGQSIKYYDEALDALDLYAKEKAWSQIRFILPPLFYAKEELTAWINAMYRRGYKAEAVDVNYAFDLKKVYTEEYAKNIQHNARKNLRIALDSGLDFFECRSEEEVIEAYRVIEENRFSKGFPLRMTCEQVLSTIDVVEHNVFLVKKSGENIAAALVYQIYPDMAQVIYWGERPGFAELKSINFLSYNLIQYYGKKGLKYLDIGISTEESVPNYGLCDFKESIGCERDLKITMVKKIGE